MTLSAPDTSELASVAQPSMAITFNNSLLSVYILIIPTIMGRGWHRQSLAQAAWGGAEGGYEEASGFSHPQPWVRRAIQAGVIMTDA